VIREGFARCYLRPRKTGSCGFEGGIDGGLGLNVGKWLRIVGRWRKSYMFMAQDKALNEVLADKQITLEGILRVEYALVKDAP